MTCLRIAETKNCPLFLGDSQSKKTCAIQCALIAIAIAGMAFSICAIVSYLPPSAGYAGGGVTFMACISLAISQVKKYKNNSARSHVSQPNSSSEVHAGNHRTERRDRSRTALAVSDLPDEIYLNIFSKCHAKELLVAGQVNRRWRNLASDYRLWKALCEQETACPPVASSPTHFSWKTYLLNFHSLPKRIRESQSPPTVRDISSPPECVSIVSFLKTPEYCFFCFSDASFEIWNASLNTRLLKTSIHMGYQMWIKMQRDLVYVVGNEYIRKDCSRRVAHVFNVKTQQTSSYYQFDHCVPLHSPPTYPFEINEKGAFLGQEDGVIAVWDLSLEPPKWRPWTEKPVLGCNYDDSPTAYWNNTAYWNAHREKCWQESFTMEAEEGKRVRSGLQCQHDKYEKMNKRKMLQGHTKGVSSLCITDHFLFSSSWDKTIRQWDLQWGSPIYQCLRTISIDIPQAKFSVFAKDLQVSGKWIFGVVEKEIYQWDISSGEYITSFALTDRCESFQVLGNLLVCLSHLYEPKEERMIRVFDLVRQTEIKTFSYPCVGYYSHCQLMEHQLMAISSKHKFMTWDF